MRARLLGSLGLAVLGALALGAPARAQTVKVGVILTYSGPEASLGETIDRGIKLWMKEHEKDLPAGIKVELIRRDDTGPNPEVAKRLAPGAGGPRQGQPADRGGLVAECGGDRADHRRGQACRSSS
ncbi:MAG: hypothetical protein WDO24_10605 [Pseudomonadota bacterium]